MSKIKPCLWFDQNAEEAVNFYITIFKNSRVLNASYYNEAGPGEPGSVLMISFELEGQEFQALNGGPHFQFTPAISLSVGVETQAELDKLWNQLSADPEQEQCGWLIDKFGLSWQIVPSIVGELMNDQDPERSKRVMEAILKMKKLDIEALKQAHEG